MIGPPTVLVYRALGLGDLLTAVPAMRAVRKAFPDHRVVLAAPKWMEELALHTGAIDALTAAAPLARLDPRVHRPDVAVNLHGKGPQSHRVVLATEPARLIAFRHPGIAESSSAPLWKEDEHEVGRWCRLLVESGIPADPEDLDIEPPDVVPEDAIGATLVHPGAASAARRWPPDRWAAVVRRELDRGRRVVVTGGPDEVELAVRVASLAGAPECARHAGGTSVMDLTALVAAAARVVCGDTGIAHLATALGRPSLVLFGPVEPRHWGPPASRSQHRVLWAGRRGDPHGQETHPGLLEIGIDDVARELAAMNAATPEPATRSEDRLQPAARGGEK